MEILRSRPAQPFTDSDPYHSYDISDEESDGEIHFERPIFLRPPTRGAPAKAGSPVKPTGRGIDLFAAQKGVQSKALRTFGPSPINTSNTHIERSTFSSGSDSVASVAHRSNGRTQLFRRFFSRSPGSKTPTRTHFDFEPPPPMPTFTMQSAQLGFAITPSPVFHPLLNKPQARVEAFQGSALAVQSRIGSVSKPGQVSAQTGSRKPSIPLLTAAAAIAPPTQSLASPTSIDSDIRGSVSTSSTLSVDAKSTSESPRQRLMDHSVASISPEKKLTDQWNSFVKCYAEGRFNLSYPPEPPTLHPSFDYFSAPLPANETERLAAVAKMNIAYPDWAMSKVVRVVSIARRVFQTRCAALSLIDDSSEVFKAEIGYNRRSVSRGDSFGAHVLLSNEPMVILDTHKDWRVRSNPLVTTAPYVRFYAGVPIVNSEGYTVGTLCVFDSQPKEDFAITSRRKLVDFAKVAATEMELILDELESKDGKRSDDDHSPREAIARQRLSRDSTKSDDDTSSIDGGSMRMRRNASKLLKAIEEEADSSERRGRAGLNLSRSLEVLTAEERLSRSKSRTRSSSQRPDSLRLNTTQSTRSSFNAGSGDRQSKNSVIFVDVPTPPQTPSRPFSIASHASTTVQKQPPNTPATSDRPMSNASDSSRRSKPRQLLDPNKLMERPDLLQLPRSPGPVTSIAEATFATSLLARNYNYDLVYLLRVKPTHPDCTEEELHATNGLSIRVIVSQGMPNPQPIFHPGLHLRALRSDGGLIYHNPNQDFTDDDEVGYRLGALLPLHREESQYDNQFGCRAGVVLAAFRKNCNGLSPDELQTLREGGEALRNIFINAPDAKSSVRSPSL